MEERERGGAWDGYRDGEKYGGLRDKGRWRVGER